MSSLDSIKEETEKAVSFVEWLAEVLRGRNWVTKLLLADVLVLAFLNPIVSLPMLLKFLPSQPTLPVWYPLVFWPVTGLVFVAALLVAYRAVPRKAEPDAGFAEHKAIKGLRPFGFEDAEVFARLQREVNLEECLATITDRDFRFGVLCGESGCGKTSFLQACLWPRLLKQNHPCVYVKFTELDPLDSLRQALAEKSQLSQEQLGGTDLPALLATVAPAGSAPLVMLFDQFEQFFVCRQRKEEREPFVQALAEWYTSRPAPPVKILISLREDFYGRLIELQKAMGYSLGPQQSLRLEKFTPKEAAAIFRVIAETEDLPCDEDFMQELTERELASREDGLISAVDLQILAWMIRGQRSAEERAFNRTAFHKLGGLEGLLERFLSRALQARETEGRRQAILKILVALTDLERNVRAGVLSAEQVENKLGGTVAPEEVQEALEWLARGDVRLATPIEREDSRGYELAHERLIPALRRLAGKELSTADQANQLLDRRVNEWLGNNRANRYLLTWRELRLILRQKPYLLWGTHASQKEALLTRSRRRFQAYTGVLSLLVLLSISVLAWWFSPRGQIWQVERDLLNLADEVKQIDTLTGIVEALSMAGHLGKALQATDRIENAQDKVPALIRIATATANTGDIAKASGIFKQSLQVADRIGNESSKARALVSIALAVAEIGNKTWASALLEKARKATEAVDGFSREEVSVAIAAAMAQTGDETRAATLFNEVVRITHFVEDANAKAYSLRVLALATAEAGAKVRALAFFKEALQVAKGIQDLQKKADHVARVFEDAQKFAREAESLALVEQGIQVTEGIDDAEWKSLSLAAISIFLARRGDKDKTRALAILKEARQETEKIEDIGKRYQSQIHIVQATAWVASLTADRALLKHAREIAEKIGEPSRKRALNHVWAAEARFTQDIEWRDRFKEYKQISELLDKGKWRRLREMAASSPNDEDRASFLAMIVRKWAQRRNPALAKVGGEEE